MAQTVYHASVEGAQHGAKSLANFLAYAKKAGTQPSNHTSRPKIPAHVQRQILVEAGHRCVACGTPFPLERAHIIRWSDSKDHRPENLICLCANCHERADKEKWDEKTLYEYKRNPWVNRQNSSSQQKIPEFATVEIVIDLKLRDSEEKHQLWLQHALANFLEVSPNAVKIKVIHNGSAQVSEASKIDQEGRLMSEFAYYCMGSSLILKNFASGSGP